MQTPTTDLTPKEKIAAAILRFKSNVEYFESTPAVLSEEQISAIKNKIPELLATLIDLTGATISTFGFADQNEMSLRLNTACARAYIKLAQEKESKLKAIASPDQIFSTQSMEKLPSMFNSVVQFYTRAAEIYEGYNFQCPLPLDDAGLKTIFQRASYEHALRSYRHISSLIGRRETWDICRQFEEVLSGLKDAESALTPAEQERSISIQLQVSEIIQHSQTLETLGQISNLLPSAPVNKVSFLVFTLELPDKPDGRRARRSRIRKQP